MGGLHCQPVKFHHVLQIAANVSGDIYRHCDETCDEILEIRKNKCKF